MRLTNIIGDVLTPTTHESEHIMMAFHFAYKCMHIHRTPLEMVGGLMEMVLLLEVNNLPNR